jgi:hypothetical protein
MLAGCVRRAVLAAFVAAHALAGSVAHAQSHVVRGGFVGFGTGDDVNCPTGIGVVGGAELRTGGRAFVGLGADLYVATPQVCTTVGRVVSYPAGYADELGGVTLLFAPRLSARLGTHFEFDGVGFEPSAAVGLLYAPELWGNGARSMLPFAGGGLAIQPQLWRIGLLLEYGYHRVPIKHRMREDGAWRTVHEFGTWKPLLNLGVRLAR